MQVFTVYHQKNFSWRHSGQDVFYDVLSVIDGWEKMKDGEKISDALK